MAINNYGLYWKRDDVYWGKRGKGNAGNLLGIKAGNEQLEVDFAQQEGVYALYTEVFSPVYVGVAGIREDHCLLARLKDHTKDHLADRWSLFSWFGTKAVTKGGKLQSKSANVRNIEMVSFIQQIEGVLIATMEPSLNKQGGSFGDGVHQYRQRRDVKKLGPSRDEMLEAIYEKLIGNP